MAIALLVLTGLNALAAGAAFMVEPSGSGMGMTTDYLKYSPFRDFFFPGLLLFRFIGLFSVVVAFLTVKKYLLLCAAYSFTGVDTYGLDRYTGPAGTGSKSSAYHLFDHRDIPDIYRQPS